MSLKNCAELSCRFFSSSISSTSRKNYFSTFCRRGFSPFPYVPSVINYTSSTSSSLPSSSSSSFSSHMQYMYSVDNAKCIGGVRMYSDSVEIATRIKGMTDVNEILDYYTSYPDMNILTLETTIRAIAKLVNSSSPSSSSSSSSSVPTISQLSKDERFDRLITAICSSVQNADSRIIAMLCNACAYLRSSPPQIRTLLDTLHSIIIKRENSFSPRNLSTIALALSILNYKQESLIEFIRVECIKCIADFSPADLYVTLEAFRRWGVFNRELTDMIVEKMTDDLDKFTSKDVVESIHCLAQAGLARGFLLRRLANLAYENLQQLSGRQAASLLHSLTKLRFIKINEVDEILHVLKPHVHTLHYTLLSQTLFSLTVCDYMNASSGGSNENLISEIIDIYTHKNNTHFVDNKSLASLVDFAYSLSFFQLFEKNDLLKAALTKVFKENPIRNRFTLCKLWEIMNSIEIENTSCKVDLPFDWRAAMEEADRLEQDKSENSRVHNEILILLDGLRGKYKINMQRNKSIKNYKVDFFDEETKIVLEIDLINKHTNKIMKHRHLSQLGYIPVCINYWMWRRCRSEEDQVMFLKDALTPALVQAGKLNEDSLNMQE